MYKQESSKIAQIDAVIAWVDGNDPKQREKIEKYADKKILKANDVAGPTRFNSVGEIYYCVASILRFAPFIQNIFIVTDDQNPGLDDMVETYFPGRKENIKIIDHKIIFKGLEESLPTFSSMSIETCLHKIPELSENFVYFNDDFFLVRPVHPNDWFVEDKVKAYGTWRLKPLDELVSMVKPRKGGLKPIGYKDTLIQGAKALNYFWKYFHFEHTPHPLKKSVLNQIYSDHPDLFVRNTAFKFRHADQFNPQELYYLYMFRNNKALKNKPEFLYIKPEGRGKGYIKRKMDAFEKNKGIKFACIGSLDNASQNDRNVLLNWLSNLLDLNLAEL